MNGKNRFGTALAALMILSFAASPGGAAEEAAPAAVQAVESRLDLGESSVAYPRVTGLADTALEEEINRRILQDTGILEYQQRMNRLILSGSIRVAWRGGVYGDIFSCAVSAEGAVTDSSRDYVWTCSNIDLTDGHEIALAELFTDVRSAAAAIGAYLEEKVAPELSAHLQNARVTPLPGRFMITRRGLTLLYDREQWSTLGDRAADVMIGWNEIQAELNLSEGSVLSRAGVPAFLNLTAESADALRRMTEEGAVPDLPVRLGGSVREAVGEWHLLTDPDLYADGRMFALEGGCFRNVFLLTDRLSESWEDSVIDGIRMDEGCLWGLRIGQTRAEEWRALLGDPVTVEFDEERAELHRTVPGTRDYYEWGGHQLRLHADGDGVLVSIQVCE